MSKVEGGITLLVLGVIALMVWDVIGEPLYNRDLYRRQVLALYDSLEPGTPRRQVRDAMNAGRHPDLVFHQTDSERWSASAPLEFGARNWVLVIEFRDDRVTALRIRTADGDHDHPAEAPADKVRTPV